MANENPTEIAYRQERITIDYTHRLYRWRGESFATLNEATRWIDAVLDWLR